MAKFRALTIAGAALLALTRLASAADLLPPPPALEPLPPPMMSADLGGWYLRGDIGMAVSNSSPSMANLPDPLAGNPFWGVGATQAFNNTTISSSQTFDIGVGYRFNSWLRGDVTLEYRDGGHFQSLYAINSPTVGAGNITQLTDAYRANVASFIGMANVYADLGTWYGLTPFVGAGLGIAHNTLYGLTDSGQATTQIGAAAPYTYTTSPTAGYFNDASHFSVAYALMTGVDFNVTNNLKLELGYRYLNYGKITSGGSNCANGNGLGGGFGNGACGGGVSNRIYSTSNLSSSDFRLGLLWSLGDAPAPAPMSMPLVRKY